MNMKKQASSKRKLTNRIKMFEWSGNRTTTYYGNRKDRLREKLKRMSKIDRKLKRKREKMKESLREHGMDGWKEKEKDR